MDNKRIIGLDFARGIAVWGMILMNFKIVMTDDRTGALGAVMHFLEGHFGVMFVVLAGTGISLFMKKAIQTGDLDELRRKKIVLIKRSIFLIVLGLLFSHIWQADILHYYGFYIMLGVLAVTMSTKRIWGMIVIFTMIFPILFLTVNYESGWDWNSLTYIDFWTVRGFIRNTFFNGFHPVFPWVAFLFLGIAFGRINFTKENLKKYLVISLIVAVVTEVLAHYLVSVTPEPLSYLFVRDAMPPAPLFVIASGAEAIFMIVMSIFLADILKNSVIIKPMVVTGQMVLSHYITHIFIGLGILEVVGRMTGQTLVFSAVYSTVYFVFAVLSSVLWSKYFKRGPFELIMRKVAG